MALMQQDLPTSDQWAANTPILPALPRRRSGRNVRNTAMRSYPNGKRATYKEDSSSASEDGNKKHKELPGKEGVDAAMDGLKRMESRFRNTAKRQKLAVTASSVMGSKVDDSPEDQAFHPPDTQAGTTDETRGQEVAPSRTEKLLIKSQREKPRQENLKAPELDNDAAQGPAEAGGGDVEPEDVSTLKEAGARPPPVNSDYLPLPWKGRLGYVSDLQRIPERQWRNHKA